MAAIKPSGKRAFEKITSVKTFVCTAHITTERELYETTQPTQALLYFFVARLGYSRRDRVAFGGKANGPGRFANA